MHTILSEEKNPALRQIAQELPIGEIKNKKTQNLIKEMKALLSKEKYGVALAAPQVGEVLRLFIVSGKALARGKRNAPDTGTVEETPKDSKLPTGQAPQSYPEPALPDQVYINPKLLKMSRGKSEKHEGCLSIRGKWGIVPRVEKATVRAYDENGVQFTRGASGFLAHIFQHELDHLEGILYTDKATELYDEEAEEKK
ncbi:MAG: peptide deformylase [bacterium]|nr:peptide deformylase [bacterium]